MTVLWIVGSIAVFVGLLRVSTLAMPYAADVSSSRRCSPRPIDPRSCRSQSRESASPLGESDWFSLSRRWALDRWL